MALIKICGITEEKEIDYLNETCPDFAGFVLFFPKSKRNITVERAARLIGRLRPEIKSVAVTVKPTLEQIGEIEAAGFDYIQIHGDIDEDTLSSVGIPIIKAFNVSDLDAFNIYSKSDKVHGYVFDASVPGSGKTFDWELVKTLPVDDKFSLIAGGIGCDNAVEALLATNASGVDTSSGVENDDGVGKSHDKIKRLIGRVRELC